MFRPNYPRLESLFHAACELAPAELEPFLERECADDHSLRREVVQLLRGHIESTGQLLAGPASAVGSSESIREGMLIGKYRIQEKVDEGGMGVIYSAWHELLSMPVVVKVLRSSLAVDKDMVQRFLNEARAAARIRDPGIVRVYDVDRYQGGDLYIVMEMLDGENLQQRLQGGPVAHTRATRWVRQVARALSVTHDKNIVHRDLKPSNVFLVRDPEVPGGERVKLLDFGIAKLMENSHEQNTLAGMMLGTPPYMAPEQFVDASKVDHRADLYSLGVIMFESICGRRPFTAETYFGYLEAHRFEVPPAMADLVPDVPPALNALGLRLLAKRPGDRVQTARELAYILDQQAGAEPLVPERSIASVLGRVKSDVAVSRVSGTVDTVVASPAARRRSDPRLCAVASESVRSCKTADQRAKTDRSAWRDLSIPALAAVEASQTGAARPPSAASEAEPRAHMESTDELALRPEARGRGRLLVRLQLAGLFVVLTFGTLLLAGPHVSAGLSSRLARESPTSPEPSVEPSYKPPNPTVDIGDQDALRSRLREFIDSHDRETRLDLLDVLAHIASPAFAELIYRALEKREAPAQLRAAEVLAEFGWPDAAPRVRAVLQRAVGPQRVQLAVCLLALGDDSAVELLRDERDDRGPLQIQANVILLKKLRDVRSERRLRRILGERSASTRGWQRAADALLAHGNERAQKLLLGEMSRSEPERALFAAGSLTAHGHPAGPEYLRRVLDEPSYPRRLQAATLLARAGDPAALGPVRGWLASDDPRARQVAVQIAGRFASAGGSDVRDLVRRLIDDDDRLVRMAALAAELAFLHITPESQGDSQ